jgi:hypothetical protein
MNNQENNSHKSKVENQREFYLNLNIGSSIQGNQARLAAQEVAKKSLEKARQLLEHEQQ